MILKRTILVSFLIASYFLNASNSSRNLEYKHKIWEKERDKLCCFRQECKTCCMGLGCCSANACVLCFMVNRPDSCYRSGDCALTDTVMCRIVLSGGLLCFGFCSGGMACREAINDTIERHYYLKNLDKKKSNKKMQ